MVFVAWLRDLSWKVKIVCLFLLEITSRKFLILQLFNFPVFYCKYRLRLLLFSLIVLAFPACSASQLVYSTLSSFFASDSKDICTLQHRFLCFLLFLYFIFIPFPALSHMNVILIPSARSLRFRMTRTETFSITIYFKEPLLFITFSRETGSNRTLEKKMQIPYDRRKQIIIEICRLLWNCYLADSRNNALE